MCVNKLRILNKGYNPSDMLSTKYIEVPCGKCWQCRLQKANNYSFRILQELSKPNCIPFFVTFTYNNTYRPVLDYFDTDDNGQCILKSLSVWNRLHLKKFHKVVRRQLQYYFGIDSSAFKYLVTCERGSNDTYISDTGKVRVAQAVPHYHAIYLLFSANISPIRPLPSDFVSFCKTNVLSLDLPSFFKFLLHNRWFYGNVDDKAFCRDVVACVRYVCKYILKDTSEKLFDVDISQIKCLHDKAFDESNKEWLDSGKFVGYDGLIKCYEYGKKAPSDIRFSDLCPRPLVSINLGFGFVDNKSFDELSNFLTGKQKVSLPSVKSCSLISLPSYYYRKLCYKVIKLHLNRWYTRPINEVKSFHIGSLFTSPKYSYSVKWSNVFGLETHASKSSYSVSTISEFGKYIRRVSFLNEYKQFKNFLKNVVINLPYFSSLYRQFCCLPGYLKSCVPSVSDDFVKSLSTVSFSFSLRDFLLYKRDLCESRITNLINFVKLCQFTITHLQHLSYEKQYSSKLASTAFDNPDLFISHFI